MSDSGWRKLAAVGVWLWHADVLAQTGPVAPALPSEPVDSTQVASPHIPVRFLHDQFHLELAGTFASASLGVEGKLPGMLGLSNSGLAHRLSGLGYRQNGVPFQAGEFYWQGGSGEELGVRADRSAWEGEPLGFPPSGADDPAMLPGPQDSAFLFPVPLFGYQAAELVLWRDPGLPDSAKATARYTNGPAGYSYTGGRFRTELGAGVETDAQVYRIFSTGLEDSSGYDGHNLDLELRKQWGTYPLRVRFRQSRADRDFVFRWEEGPSRAAHSYYLTYLTVEAARTAAASEWLLAYDLRVENQEKRALPALSSYQYWFDRRHKVSLSRVSQGQAAYWATASGEYRESDSSTGLPGAFATDFSAGLRVRGERASLLVSGGTRLFQEQATLYRAATVLRYELFSTDVILVYAGAARESASPIRLYLPGDSGVAYSEEGVPGLPVAKHASAALAWRHEAERLTWDVVATFGTSSDLPAWQPSGDTAGLASPYLPVATDRKGATMAGHIVWRPLKFLEWEGSWRHLLASSAPSVTASYSPQDSWFGAVRLPLAFARVHLVITPEIAATGEQGGTLPQSWWALSFGVDARLKQLTVFWHRDNAGEEVYRSGGAYPWYGAHSRFGFSWDFWN